MAVISANTFDPLKRYIGVRLQQGVPLVDADWNELEDARRFELRAYLKWYVGDGVPEGTDGFRLAGTGLVNDLAITAGAPTGTPANNVEKGLRNVGRCLVDGLDVIIDVDVNLRSQPLHSSQAGAAAKATAWGVPVVTDLPSLNGTVLLYLDVWERLVTPTEDPALIFAGVGTESCARMKREWVVRWRNSTVVPVSGNSDYLAGHSYLALARVTRRTTDTLVNAADVVDLRAKRLLLPPASIVEDLFDSTPDRYRNGLDRPNISLRRALNALVRGDLPGTADAELTPSQTTDTFQRSVFPDANNGLISVWTSGRTGSYQAYAARLDLANRAAGFGSVTQVTTGVAHNGPQGALLPTGELVVTSQANSVGVTYKRAMLTALGAASEVTIAAGTAFNYPMAVVSGTFVVFFFWTSATNQWQFRRLRHTDNVWIDAAPVNIGTATGGYVGMHAAVDANGDIWMAYQAYVTSALQISAIRLTPLSGVTGNVGGPWNAGSADQPFVMCSSRSGVWITWGHQTGVAYSRIPNTAGAWSGPTQVPGLPSAYTFTTTTVEDAGGALWLFYISNNHDVMSMCFNSGGNWTTPRQLTSTSNYEYNTLALQTYDGVTWVFWYTMTFPSYTYNVNYRQLYTTV